MAYEYNGLGYRVDLEDREELLAGAQAASSVYFGDVDPKSLGEPLGMEGKIRIEDQSMMNSCAGQSGTSVLEACLYVESQGQVNVELSRQFAYVNGQKYAGIGGDQGCTLKGVIDGAQRDGVPLETFAPYTGSYYTRFSEDARQAAKAFKLGAYAPITDVDQLYEALAKRMGFGYFGMAWAGQFKQPLAGGYVDEFYEPARCGFHAVCFLDWSTEKDRDGYPRLKLWNSHGTGYGRNGISYWSRRAVQQAITSANTSCYTLSNMQFIKPRFDYKKAIWMV